MYREQSGLFERLIAALSYITFGTVGFIWLLISFFTKNNLGSFLKFHIFQSIFISILYYIVSSLLALVMQILSVIPIINELASRVYFMLNMPFFFGFSLINSVIYLIILYLVFTSLFGRYSYLPWISGIIAENLKR